MMREEGMTHTRLTKCTLLAVLIYFIEDMKTFSRTWEPWEERYGHSTCTSGSRGGHVLTVPPPFWCLPWHSYAHKYCRGRGFRIPRLLLALPARESHPFQVRLCVYNKVCVYTCSNIFCPECLKLHLQRARINIISGWACPQIPLHCTLHMPHKTVPPPSTNPRSTPWHVHTVCVGFCVSFFLSACILCESTHYSNYDWCHYTHTHLCTYIDVYINHSCYCSSKDCRKQAYNLLHVINGVGC